MPKYNPYVTGLAIITLVDNSAPQIEVARACGTSSAEFSRIKRGQNSNPDPDVVARIAAYYHVASAAITVRVAKTALRHLVKVSN
jgi:transcriptional regulator with XRE-family HTH domain